MEAGENATPPTVYVCVRDRNGKGKSCAGSGSRQLIQIMRDALERENIGAAELTIRPSGCIGPCKQGPVAVVAGPEWQGGKKAPKPGKDTDQRGVHTRLEAKDVRGLLRAALRGETFVTSKRKKRDRPTPEA